MKTKITFYVLAICILFLLNKNINAQQNNFIFDFDYAQFGYDTTSNYVEFYYSFDQSSLTKIKKDSAVYVEGILHITLENNLTNTKAVDNDWKISYKVASDTSIAEDKSLIGVVGFVIPQGDYTSDISGRDASDSSEIKSYKETISIKPFMNDGFSLSDVQLSSKILQESPNESSVFYKNTYEVIPIPTCVFGGSQPVVFYYCELYKLKNSQSDNPLKMQTLVVNSKGKRVFTRAKDIAKRTDSRVEVGTFLINKYPTDSYTLIVSLFDTLSNVGLTSSKKFFVYNPDVAQTDTAIGSHQDILGSEFAVMSEEEIDLLFSQSKYIATSNEIDEYNKITELEGKRKYLYEFWKKRDPDSSTPGNEFYNKYFSRVKASNQKYSTISRAGWRSDRGRIFIMYGDPSEIERYPNQIDSKPYEIWHYNEIEGGVVFVFADLTGFSDYTLLHSTLRGELRDDNWTSRISSF